jgi:hypothetical protein
MNKISIEDVWIRIKKYKGEEFRQIRGQKFTYEITGMVLRPSTTNHNLPASQFEKALPFLPLDNTAKIQNLRGPSYIYAILMDKRIRQDEWWKKE